MPNLVDNLIKEKYLKSPAIIKAFKKIKRSDFMRKQEIEDAELDIALPIGKGQTISQPATVAFMLENLEPKKGDKALDVGSGSGWTTALLCEIVGSKGKVFAIERVKELKEFGEKNASKYNFIKTGRAKFFHGDGTKGLPKQAPFDKILISAGGKEIPNDLKEQLKIGGKLLMPVGGVYSQDLILLTKTGKDKFRQEKYPGFVFVPLVED